MPELSWPPQYTIRRSKRASSASLRLCPGQGLEVVVPLKKRTFDVAEFVETHRDWIIKHAHKLKIELHEARDDTVLPDSFYLPCIDLEIQCLYRPIASARRVTMQVTDNKFIFYGRVDSFKACVPLITAALKIHAKNHFEKWLRALAEECGFTFEKLSIRNQRTVWGSCTVQKHIQLNYKILFLPAALARYILIHELCHTVHMNHSKSFWQLVSRHVPDFKYQVRALREADQFIPRWLSARMQSVILP